jgi:autotransporter-associated beta strand protein
MMMNKNAGFRAAISTLATNDFTATTMSEPPCVFAVANGRRVTPENFRALSIHLKPQPATPLKIAMQPTPQFMPAPVNLRLNRNPLRAGGRTKSKIKNFALATLSTWLTLLASCTVASGATYTWTGAGFFGNQDYLWSNPANWTPVGAPQPGETNVTLIFPDNNAPKIMTNDIVGLNVAAIHFQGTNYIVHGSPAGNVLGLKGNPGSGWLITVAQGNQVSSDTRCRFAEDCPLSFKTSGDWEVQNNATFVVNSTISGSGGFTLTGGGWLYFLTGLGKANSYSGRTHVLDASMFLANGFDAGEQGSVSIPGPLIVGGTNYGELGTIHLGRGGTISPGSHVTVHAYGRIWFAGHTNTFASLTMEQGGEVKTDYPVSGLGSGLLRLNGGITNSAPVLVLENATITGNMDLGSATRVIDAKQGSFLSIESSISGNGGLTKIGGGGMRFLNGPNTYNGPTLVQGGYVELIHNDAVFGSTAAGTTIAGGRVELGFVQIGQEALTIYGSNGVVSVESSWGSPSSWDGPITLYGNCTFDCPDGENPGDDGSLTLSGAINGTGSLRKKGDGPLYLEGLGGNNFSGGMIVEEGVVRCNKSASAPALGGPLTIGISNSAVSASVVVQQINQIPNNVPVTIHKSGYLSGFIGANDVLGDVIFYGGELWGSMFTLSGNVTNHASPGDAAMQTPVSLTAGEHIFHCGSNSVLHVNGPMQGSGAVTKTGSGELVLADANTYSGLTLVREGQLTLQGTGRPGSSAAGTTIYNRAKLYLDHASVTNESLTLYGTGTYGESVCSDGTNRWAGLIVMAADATFATTNLLILDGPISGAGDFTLARGHYSGPGVIEMTGNSANTYSGVTKVHGGTLRLNKSSGGAIPGDVVVGLSNLISSLSLVRSNQISDLSDVTVQSGHSFALNGNNETIGSLEGAGQLNLGLGTLTTGGAGNITTFSGLIHGNGGLTKTGGGTFTLTANNLYTGPTTVNGGTLVVQGLQPFSQVSLQNGAMLGGSGRVGNLNDLSGHIAPGNSPGILVCSNFSSISLSNQLQIEINGSTPGTQHDQLKVYGGVLLIGATLQVTMNTMGVISNQYVIIDNDGIDAIGGGGFTGLPEGSMLTNNGVVFQISYTGGTGNDVVLTQIVASAGPQFANVEKLANGTIQLIGTGFPNTTYTVEATQSLNPPVQWIAIGSIAADENGQISFTDSQAPNFPMRFYRFKQ